MLQNAILGDRHATDQVLMDDPFEDGRVALPVPDAFRVDDGDRAAAADAQTVRLVALDASVFAETEFLQPGLQELPGDQAPVTVTALRIGLVAAEEDVTSGDIEAELLGDPALRLAALLGSAGWFGHRA